MKNNRDELKQWTGPAQVSGGPRTVVVARNLVEAARLLYGDGRRWRSFSRLYGWGDYPTPGLSRGVYLLHDRGNYERVSE